MALAVFFCHGWTFSDGDGWQEATVALPSRVDSRWCQRMCRYVRCGCSVVLSMLRTFQWPQWWWSSCVSESRASARHDAVWILGNLRLSGHQHEGGRILTLVDDVNDVCWLFRVSRWFAVVCSMRRASMHANVLPISFGEWWEPSKIVEAPHCCFVSRRLIVLEGVWWDCVQTQEMKTWIQRKIFDEATCFGVYGLWKRAWHGATRMSYIFPGA